MNDKWQKAILWLVGGLFSIVGIYLVLPSTDNVLHISDGVTNNNYSRENFYTDYRDMVTNNTQVVGSDNISNSVLNGDYVTANNSNLNYTANRPTDLKDIAKEITKHFVNGEGHFVYQGNLQRNGGFPQPPDPVVINNRSLQWVVNTNWDCSGFVDLMLFYAGYNNDYIIHDIDVFPRLYIDEPDKYELVKEDKPNEKITFEGLEVGDILSYAGGGGHVAIVAAVDSTKVYIADCGGDDNIENTYKYGFHAAILKTSYIHNTWGHRSDGNRDCIVIRPISSRISVPVTSVASSGDLCDHAKAIASQFKDGTDNYIYSQTIYVDVTYGDLSKSVHPDCSGFVSAMANYLGYFSGYFDSKGFYNDRNYFDTVIDNSPDSTFGDLMVGDIICKKGHVAIVVAINNSTVYMGDCGWPNKIQDTAEQGYAEEYAKTAKLSTWRDGSYRVKRAKN